jgi:hypothetical protein
LRILLVEPDYRRNARSLIEKVSKARASKWPDDESLWYPPLGLMKLATFHKMRGDEVKFVYGCNKNLLDGSLVFSSQDEWDRIYIATLFTYQWGPTKTTIEFYKRLARGDINKIFVGGIMASLLPEKVMNETGICPVKGVINSPHQIGLSGTENIDLLQPAYDILDNRLYAINDTYYAHTTRGCINACEWCGVPKIEPGGINYIDIKENILSLRQCYGDKPKLKLMDNNILASDNLERIVDDLITLGYGKNNFTDTIIPKERVIDFNQGLDATYLTNDRMELLSKLSIKPMRIAFDRIRDQYEYVKAVEIAKKHGVKSFSNYMLYNFKDTPKDLYERLIINIKLNTKWRNKIDKPRASIYSYPMRYASIHSTDSPTTIRQKQVIHIRDGNKGNPLGMYNSMPWNNRFIRNVEVMKGVAHGSISPTPTLAKRTIGWTYRQFVANLYMPEELLRNRNKYERKVYKSEPKRSPGTGDIERFRLFIFRLIAQNDERFTQFHEAISQNRKTATREYLAKCKDKEITKWLRFYLK